MLKCGAGQRTTLNDFAAIVILIRIYIRKSLLYPSTCFINTQVRPKTTFLAAETSSMAAIQHGVEVTNNVVLFYDLTRCVGLSMLRSASPIQRKRFLATFNCLKATQSGLLANSAICTSGFAGKGSGDCCCLHLGFWL